MAAAAIALAIAAVAVIAVASGGNSKATVSASVGGGRHFHKNLAIAYPPGVKTVTASVSKPDSYAIEGYAVHVVLPSGSAMVQVEGPDVPSWVEQDTQAGTLKLATPVPSTFSVKVTDVKGTIPLDAKDWSVELATDQATTINAKGVGAPITVRAGQTRTYQVRMKLPDGDGVIQWKPSGSKPVVAWSWQLEYD